MARRPGPQPMPFLHEDNLTLELTLCSVNISCILQEGCDQTAGQRVPRVTELPGCWQADMPTLRLLSENRKVLSVAQFTLVLDLPTCKRFAGLPGLEEAGFHLERTLRFDILPWVACEPR